MYVPKVKNERLLEIIIRMSITHPFYFYILTQCSFREDTHSALTAAVYYESNASLMFVYNPNFFNKLTDTQLLFVGIHEVQHLISNHIKRTLALGLNHELSNIAADMIINQNIVEQYKLPLPTQIVDGKETNMGLLMPPEYNEERVMEILYNYLEKNMPPQQKITVKITIPGSGQGDDKNQGKGEGNGEGDIEVEVPGYKDKKGNVLLDREEIKKAIGAVDKIPDNLKDALVDQLLDTAIARGTISGDESAMLQKLRKSKKNYLAEIKSYVSTLLGSIKKVSWRKFSRKYDLMPGFHRINNEISVILDTSGSMSGMIEKVLAYIFHHDVSCHIIQCDTEIHNVIECTCPNDIQKMKVSGFGGTELQPAINYIAGHKLLKQLPLVVLTDGYTDTLDFSNIKQKVLAITCGEKVPMKGRNNHVKVIKVEKS